MLRTGISILALVLLIALAVPIFGQTAGTTGTPAANAKNDYSKPDTWLCRPGRKDACTVDMSTTVIAADGKFTKETFTADPKAPIDCFYVYPTVSLDTTGNSDMNAGPEENNVVRGQFARFGSQCRLYAPLYRQVTLTALRASMAGQAPPAVDRNLGYSDVVDAWKYYLQHDNQGRGVVLVGHSQGSGVLTQLIRTEIDGKPDQAKLISALLLGSNVAVPKGRDVGGTFKNIPLCHAANQTGCIITYVSFRSTTPPPPNSRFGRVQDPEMTAACTNPAALGGGSGELHSYFNAGATTASAQAKPWVTPSKPIETQFVSVPGLITGQCVSEGNFSYLAVTVHGKPADPRADDISGDVYSNGKLAADWGLHLIDAHVAMGNLVSVVGQQGKAYLSKKKN